MPQWLHIGGLIAAVSVAAVATAAPIKQIRSVDISLTASIVDVSGGGTFVVPQTGATRSYEVSEIPNFQYRVRDKLTARWSLDRNEMEALYANYIPESGYGEIVSLCGQHTGEQGGTCADGLDPETYQDGGTVDSLTFTGFPNAAVRDSDELQSTQGPILNLRTGELELLYQILQMNFLVLSPGSAQIPCAYTYVPASDGFADFTRERTDMCPQAWYGESQAAYFMSGELRPGLSTLTHFFTIRSIDDPQDFGEPGLTDGRADVTFAIDWKVRILPRSFQVPEPGTIGLAGLGLAGLAFIRRRRKAESNWRQLGC